MRALGRARREPIERGPEPAPLLSLSRTELGDDAGLLRIVDRAVPAAEDRVIVRPEQAIEKQRVEPSVEQNEERRVAEHVRHAARAAQRTADRDAADEHDVFEAVRHVVEPGAEHARAAAEARELPIEAVE